MNRSSSEPATDLLVSYIRVVEAVSRRTGDPQYARSLTLDIYRASSAADPDRPVPGFAVLLTTALTAARRSIREVDRAAAREASDAGAIASLRPWDREILRLVYWDHMSMGELAEYLGCSIARAGRRLDRAYRRAERRLQALANPSSQGMDAWIDGTI